MDSIEYLKDIFQNVNSWLNFAEAKNGALVGFDIALLAINDVFLDNMSRCGNLRFYLFLLGVFFPIVSFLPLYKGRKFKKKKIQNNLLFYRDIATYDGDQYFTELKSRYLKNCSINGEDDILKDYAEEIVVNARITVYKLSTFRIGLCFSIAFIIHMVLFNTII